jgi:hypothetical protein
MERTWSRASIGAVDYTALATGLAATELWSLLMDIIERRVEQRTPADVRQQWHRDRFVQPSQIDQRTFNVLDGHLWSVASAFEAMELSPLAPLGTCSTTALVGQNKIVSTIRGTEVVSDPTNVLALECAGRLSVDPNTIVKLATSHRCVRAQPYPKEPGFAAHFRLFSLATAGHELKDHGLIVQALIEHIATHLAGLARLEQHGYGFPGRRVRVLASPACEALGRRVAAGVSDAPVLTETLDHDYYHGLRFMIDAVGPAGERVPLIDGGAFDWLAKLLSNRKIIYVASALGSQIAAYLFPRRAPLLPP